MRECVFYKSSKIGLKQDREGKMDSVIENKCSFLYERKTTFQKRYRVIILAIEKNKIFFWYSFVCKE